MPPHTAAWMAGRYADIKVILLDPMIDETDPRIPDTSTVWQLWHSDTFDRDTSRFLQSSDVNIIDGLYELWLHTLKEGILDNGSASSSYFHLTWGNTAATRADVAVNPFHNLALLKLRRWVGFISQAQESEDRRIIQRLEEREDTIILRLAQLHYELLQKSSRWKASAIDWGAEARVLLARVDLISDAEEL